MTQPASINKLGNTSSAVMQQRNKPRNDGLDDFPTPPWATRALLETVINDNLLADYGHPQCKSFQTVWEPACNRGYMARPLAEYFERVIATDIHDYGWEGQTGVCDFLFEPTRPVDWIISNPPFRLAADFIRHALKMEPSEGAAMIVRTSFLEGVDRFKTLFSITPPTIVAQFAERVPMVEGRYDPDASTATSYAWLVWLTGHSGTEFRWIPPCRRQLEREGDAA